MMGNCMASPFLTHSTD